MLASQTFLFNLDAQLLFNSLLIAIAVFILFLVLSNLLFNPARKLLQDRKDRIQKDIQDATTDKEAAAQMKAEYESKLLNIDKEVDVILSEARQRALKNETRIIAEAKEEADRIIVMDDGKAVMDGTPKEVFTQVGELRAMGLTTPDTVDLLDRLRNQGVDVPLDALTVEECADAIISALRENK